MDEEVERVQNNHDIYGDPPIAIDIDAMVDDEDVYQVRPGRGIKYSGRKGRPPTPLVTQIISQEIYMWIERLAKAASDVVGVSQLSAQGQRPTGNDISGFAYQILDDIQTVRHSLLPLERQRLCTETADKVNRLSKRVFGNRPHKVKYIARGFMESVDWSEAVQEDDEFFVRTYPASILGDQPGGRIRSAVELLKQNLLSPQEVRRELFSPDMERTRELADAPIDDIQMQIDQMLYKENYVGPTKYQDLELGQKLVNSSLLRARADGAPPEALKLLAKWLDESALILKREQQVMGQQPPLGPAQDQLALAQAQQLQQGMGQQQPQGAPPPAAPESGGAPVA
jgi:hypothetical protein